MPNSDAYILLHMKLNDLLRGHGYIRGKIILDLLNSNWVASSFCLMSLEVESCVYNLNDQKLQKIKVDKVSILLEFSSPQKYIS